MLVTMAGTITIASLRRRDAGGESTPRNGRQAKTQQAFDETGEDQDGSYQEQKACACVGYLKQRQLRRSFSAAS